MTLKRKEMRKKRREATTEAVVPKKRTTPKKETMAMMITMTTIIMTMMTAPTWHIATALYAQARTASGKQMTTTPQTSYQEKSFESPNYP
jgi:hypothetical protein